MDATKVFTALLNGLTKRTFFGETEFDNETLRSQLYPDMAPEGIHILYSFFFPFFFPFFFFFFFFSLNVLAGSSFES